MHNDPIAHFLTWTTYGTWLPGDERGWISNDTPGVQPPKPGLAENCQNRLADDTFILIKTQRRRVKLSIESRANFKGWHIHALNVRTNHVHVVIVAPNESGKSIIADFKRWCTRDLKATDSHRTKWWTRGGSARHIFTETQLEDIINYVLHGQ
ncbi:transposase [Calycomorphotria hydatis]|uniref:Transposase IS200 like protein n=1 Tax=Calycomorphotria hydatis TaxID=2528027 RepID=A0A517T3J8_9PLAN|nr:transposase [Calycomorphotria hydatis]QDT62946.1 Transposase IS200 like protein [Calycomorphotria hydatis]